MTIMKKLLFVGFVLLATVFSFHAALAENTTIDLGTLNPIDCKDLQCVVGKIVTGLNVLAIPLVTLMALIGGFQFMTASGDPKKVEQGKNTLWYAAIGYGVIFMANALVAIIKNVLGAT